LEEQAGLEVEKRLSKYVMKKSAISPGVEIIFPWISWMCARQLFHFLLITVCWKNSAASSPSTAQSFFALCL